jgi:hypothetical protein
LQGVDQRADERNGQERSFTDAGNAVSTW